MEPKQQNINILSYSFSSSSSGNLQNNSKNSEKMQSKKSILRKEGSTSKNKDKHATFVEPLNQVAFYLPDNHNQNKRISLNTVSEEPENSRSGSDLINNSSSNRIIIHTEKRISFTDNNNNNMNNFNMNNFSNNINSNNSKNNLEVTDNINIYNNRNINNGNNQYANNNFNNININQQNNIISNVENNENKNIIFKNQHIKKPKTRKTLDSEYILDGFFQNNEINNYNQINNEMNENKENTSKISNKNPPSKVVKINFSNSRKNSFINNNNINNLNQSNQEKSSSNNSTNEKLEEQTKRNTELNKNLFNINTNNNLKINSTIIPQNNNIIPNTNINNNLNNNINNQININNENNFGSKKTKKPNFKKRITIGLDKEKDFLFEDNNNINNVINNNNIANTNNINDNNNMYSNNFMNQNNIRDNTNNININNNINTNLNNNIPNNNILNNVNVNNFNNNNIPNNITNNNVNTGINNKQLENKDIKNNVKIKEKRALKMNKKRITMAIDSFDSENIFSDDIILENPQNQLIQDNSNINNNNNKINQNSNQIYPIKQYKDYNSNVNEELKYVEPNISAQNKNINYTNYEKYLKYNNINISLSEKKYNINIDNNVNVLNNNNISQTVSKNQLNDTLLNNLENYNKYNKSYKLSLDSSPLLELIHDKSKRNNLNSINIPKRNDKYSLILNNNENIDIDKEINNQINFIEKNLEDKEKNWREKIIQNAERNLDFESQISQNEKELNNIYHKTNEINNQINDLLKNKNKYDKLSEKAEKINNILSSKGIDIKDIEHISYKEMNCLLFTIMIKNNLIYKFLISDNIWLEKNISGETKVTFIGIINTEVFSNFFSEETIINKDNNINLLIQKYFNETIKKIFPKEYEEISLHNLSHKYYLSTQISLCFIHILKIINHISLIDEDISFNTQDLKKYSVKFSHITIYGAKINLEFILNIENPFSGNYLNSVEIEKNDYILNDFDDYRKKKINIIWKYFNPKDIQINHKYFYNIYIMLQYIDKIDVFKTEVNDEYIFNVMQGNIKPKEDDEFLNNDYNNFDSLELFKQLEIIYGKNYINQLMNKNDINNNIYNNEEIGNNSRDNEEEDILLHLPSSKEDDEIDKDSNNNNFE